jgi:acetolactate synthase-1/2/3 large subunit
LRGAEILVKALQAEGVKYIWGYPGGAVLHIYDAFYKQDTIQHMLVRHEQAAVHAADGYARATGEVGVALVTSGPGVTNAVTGIATAYMDSIPMVIITGQVPTPPSGWMPSRNATRRHHPPIVKHNFLVKDVRDLAETMKKAFHIARSGRPGPVVVDIPKDVSFNKTAYRLPRQHRDALVQPGAQGSRRPDPQGAAAAAGGQAALHLHRWRRAAGQRLGRAARWSTCWATPAPTRLMGLGPIRRATASSWACWACTARYEANNAMQNCDVLLAVGARFDDRVIGNPKHFRPERTQDHPHRHRPVEHFQARQGRHPDRGRRQGRADRDDRHDRNPASLKPDARLWAPGGSRSTAGASATASSTTARTPRSSSRSMSSRPCGT